MDYLFFQQYWWIVVTLVGALLVFLMFVQGGQTLIFSLGKTDLERTMLINATGRKWEFTFTTLVLFGGAFFASFPLFYSVSFGGAYWVWLLLLFSFVVQAVSYEFRSKPNNLLGKRVYETFLIINGVIGTTVVGVAVATFYNGASFTVNAFNQSDWMSGWLGLEALFSVHNLSLGVAVFFLSRVLGLLFFIKSIDNEELVDRARTKIAYNALPFLIAFLYFVIGLLFWKGGYGYAYDPDTQAVTLEAHKYWNNFLEMPLVFALFLVGVVSVLLGIYKGLLSKSVNGIWFAGVGTVLAVWALLLIAGLNNTCFYPSQLDPQSSLHILNSSSSFYTLKTMAWVSLFIPFVLAYIWYMWRAISKKRITTDELEGEGHVY